LFERSSMTEPPFRVTPSSVGPFTLGASINATHALLRARFKAQKVRIACNVAAPNAHPLVLDVVQWGLQLHFDACSQRMTKMELDTALAGLPVTFASSKLVFGPGNPCTLIKLYQLLGPTYPGTRANAGEYVLQYPGLGFTFALPSGDAQEIPLQLADKSSPMLTRLVVHLQPSGPEPKPSPGSLSPLLPCLVQISRARAPSVQCGNAKIVIGESGAQDVLAEFGSPSSVFVKNQDAAANAPGRAASSPSAGHDYFYNFSALGLDVLLDGSAHKVKKVVLHTNCPVRADFLEYAKCSFRVEWLPEGVPGAQTCSAVSCDDPWARVEKVLGKDELGRAKIFDRGLTHNPFGPSFLYGYSRCVFEVAKASGLMCSLTVF
jgi:hypothetical protein